jgi:hypothetical protein
MSEVALHRDTSLIRKHPPPRTTKGLLAEPYCRVLGGGCFL